MPFLLSIYICLLSHLTVSKTYEDSKKVVAYAVYGVIGVLYLLFGIIF